MIDAAAGEPEQQFRTIDAELREYGAGLEERPQVVVLNKVDLLPEPPELRLDDERVLAVFRISAATGAGRRGAAPRALLASSRSRRSRARRRSRSWPTSSSTGRSPDRRPRYRVLRTDRGFRVVGEAPEGEELERALKAAGVKKGAVVEIGDEELEVG